MRTEISAFGERAAEILRYCRRLNGTESDPYIRHSFADRKNYILERYSVLKIQTVGCYLDSCKYYFPVSLSARSFASETALSAGRLRILPLVYGIMQ